MKKLGIAVAGYGYWGPNIIRNFLENETARVLYCCDTSKERLAKAGRRFTGLRTTQRFTDLLNDRAVNAIAIVTPAKSHYSLAKAALERGKHVLVEKPFTTCVEHAEELCALAEKRGLVLQVDHVFVYSPPVQLMHQLIQQNRLGKIYFIDSVRINLGIFQNDVNVLWDLAPHDLSIVDFVLAKMPRSLSAIGGIHAGSDLEDVAYLNLDYGDGLIANFHVSWLSPVKVRQMIIGGSKQSLIYNDTDVSEKIKVYDRGINLDGDVEKRTQILIRYRSGDVWSPSLGNAEALSSMVADFLNCIRESRQPVTNGSSGLRVVKILDAAQRSIKAQGGRISFANSAFSSDSSHKERPAGR